MIREGATWVPRFVHAGLAAILAGSVAMGGLVAIAQEATPEPAMQSSSEVAIENPDGEQIGSAMFVEANGGVSISVEVEGLEPGDHGIHIHETGICDPAGDEPFSSAGDHFNPTDAIHGPGPEADAEGTPGVAPAEGTPVDAVSM